MAEPRRRGIDCDCAPGHRLTEDHLAQNFGVSRNPVRDAIRGREHEGFLVALPRRGAVVASISVQDVENNLRRTAVAEGARRPAGRTAHRRGRGHRAGPATRRGRPCADPAELATLNTAFHAEICGLSSNTLLAGIMESLHDRLQWIYRQSAETHAPHSWAEHQALAVAIRESRHE